MFRLFFLIIKKIILAFLIIYGVNLIVESVNIFIPINISSIGTVSILGVPGLISLFVVYLFIN